VERRRGQVQAPHRLKGNDIGRRRLTEQGRHLAEEIAATKDRRISAARADRDLAFQDDVEPGAGQAFAEDSLAFAEPNLFERVGGRVQLRTGQVREQGQGRKLVCKFRKLGHRPSSDGLGRMPWATIMCIARRAAVQHPDRTATCSFPCVRPTAPLARRALTRHSRLISIACKRGRHDTTERTAQMALSATQRAHLLAGVGLFSATTAKGRAAIAKQAVEVEFPTGRRIARQGEIETGFFLVLTGSATVARDGEVLAHLGPGDFFGELSLLDRLPRIASVRADEPTTCLALPSWEFQRLLASEPGVAAAMLKEVARRLRAVTVDHRH
jgi:CRP/FNR family cyclic AMP-dependent transcriptional regulator